METETPWIVPEDGEFELGGEVRQMRLPTSRQGGGKQAAKQTIEMLGDGWDNVRHN